MSSYFDRFDRDVRAIAQAYGNDTEGFLKRLMQLEEKLKQDSLLFSGDVETPHDVRETIVATIALYEVRYAGGDFLGDKLGESRGAQYAAACKSSKLSHELHSLWHDIASMRYQMRYGLVSDNPELAVLHRDSYAETRQKRTAPFSEKPPFKSRILDGYRNKKPDFAVL